MSATTIAFYFLVYVLFFLCRDAQLRVSTVVSFRHRFVSSRTILSFPLLSGRPQNFGIFCRFPASPQFVFPQTIFHLSFSVRADMNQGITPLYCFFLLKKYTGLLTELRVAFITCHPSFILLFTSFKTTSFTSVIKTLPVLDLRPV